MFARKIRNRSGSISVQIVRKDRGKYRVVRTIGTSEDPEEIEKLWHQAQHFIHNPDSNQDTLFPMQTFNDRCVESFTETLSNSSIRVIGPELIFGTLYERIGLNKIQDEMFRHMVIARLAYPTSKLKTADYLYRYKGIEISVNALYRCLDRLHERYKQQVEEIVYGNTQKTLRSISVVFYDMTTLYFEAEDEDDLRKIGFSKDGKNQHPQIMLGLLVAQDGLPIGYDIFKGNTFEGHTLLPVLKQIQRKYDFEQPVVIADAAMLSKANLDNLDCAQYQYIIGGRIKNETLIIKEEILKKSEGIKDGDHFVLSREDNTRLIISYSAKRARKDANNRKKGVARLEKKLKSGRLDKHSINNRGYNKFLKLQGELTVSLDEARIEEDQKWDGLKGYTTNTQLEAREVIKNYSHLWQIEKAFRISKTDLRVRPIYHYRQRRIEAHICIAFAAYAIYKELELLLKNKEIDMSARRAGELTQNMYQLHYSLPDSQKDKSIILNMDHQQQQLYHAVWEI
jgi:transposase